MSELQFRKAERKKAKIRMGLSGPAGSGKTVSALIMAYGLVGSWDKIAVIDSENESADLYANHVLPNGSVIGEFNTVPISAPYHPEKYIKAIDLCIKNGVEAIIIDSITHEWSGVGGCLELHDQAVKRQRNANSYTAWADITPLHQRFIDSILQAPVHMFTTVRSKTDYVLTEKNGKQVPQKVGMAAQTREGFEYELTVSLEIDVEHKAFISKDRTGLFSGKLPFVPSVETGQFIKAWCESGAVPEPVKPAPLPSMTASQYKQAKERIAAREEGVYDKIITSFTLTEEQRAELEQLITSETK
jgi:hypothetical protein